MRIILLLTIVFFLTGCAFVERVTTGAVTKAAVVTNQTLDTMAAPIAEFVERWCALFDYRQEHLGGLVNGMLAAQNKSINIDCDTADTTEPTKKSIFE